MGQSANQMSTAAGDDPEVIAAEIAQTRADMSETIDAIQQRLNPDTLTEQAKEKVEDLTEHAKVAAREAVEEAKVAVHEALAEARDNVREATIGRVETMVRNVSDSAYETREGVMGTIRQNPVPAALVGIGLGWLWMNRRSTPPRRTYTGEARAYRDDRDYQGRMYAGQYGAERGTYYAAGYSRDGYPTEPSRGANPVTQAAGRVGEAASNVAGTVGDTAGSVASTVGETVGNAASVVGETASNLVSTTQETAGNLVSGAQHQARRAEDGLGQAMQDNPLAVGAVALALGAAIGLALPQTQRENQLMGEARDTLLERAQGLAQETVEKVQHVATEAQQTVTQTVKEEAKSQGLTQ
jgi:uncharacterized protein YjbJ (UPF0337 family)